MTLLPDDVPFSPNALFYGDNLEILRKYFPEDSIDLIYLDPPFNSKANYNILFKEESGELSEAQIQAFTDFWHWDEASEKAYLELQSIADKVSETVKAFVSFLGRNDLTAYLVMMAIRLVELHRVLKPTGSLYLHCDPTASHYLKVVLDVIFEPWNFRNEIVWRRTAAHNDATRCGSIHDVLLFYTKSDDYVWNSIQVPLSEEYKEMFLDSLDEKTGKRYQRVDLTGAGITREGESGRPWRGIDPTSKGRHWANSHALMNKWDKEGKIHWPKDPKGMPRYKRFEEELGTMPLQDIWPDIHPIHNQSSERTGFQTQKPLKLLKRIIESSSKEGQIVLDPFCGRYGDTSGSQRKEKMVWD